MHTKLGEDCAKAFLDDIAEKHGKAKQLDDPDFKPTVVKLLAHNITYDLSFSDYRPTQHGGERYLRRMWILLLLQVRDGAKAGPNKHLAEWMEKEGAAIYYSENPVRLQHKGVWRKAVSGVRSTPTSSHATTTSRRFMVSVTRSPML